MNWFVTGYVVVVIGSLMLATIPFQSRYRMASLWLRVGFFLGGLVGVAWSGLGFYLLLHEKGGRTLLPWSRYWALDRIKSSIAGLAVGMLLSLVLSPEFLSFVRRKPPRLTSRSS